MHIVLYQPQIPQNTGNIVRTCALTGSELSLVHPLGFSTSSRMLKRSGLDYWDDVSITHVYDPLDWLQSKEQPIIFFSSKATQLYTSFSYTPETILVFGSETHGLPAEYFERWPERFATIPMLPGRRCLNLSNSVAIALYEAWRQQGFA